MHAVCGLGNEFKDMCNKNDITNYVYEDLSVATLPKLIHDKKALTRVIQSANVNDFSFITHNANCNYFMLQVSFSK